MGFLPQPEWVKSKSEIISDGDNLIYLDIVPPNIDLVDYNSRIIDGSSSGCANTTYYNISVHPSSNAPLNPVDGSVWWDGSSFYVYSEDTSFWVNITSSAASDKSVEYFVGDSSETDLVISETFLANSTKVYIDGVLCYPKTTETEALETTTGVTFWDYEEISTTTIRHRNVWPDYSRIAVYYRPVS